MLLDSGLGNVCFGEINFRSQDSNILLHRANTRAPALPNVGLSGFDKSKVILGHLYYSCCYIEAKKPPLNVGKELFVSEIFDEIY